MNYDLDLSLINLTLNLAMSNNFQKWPDNLGELHWKTDQYLKHKLLNERV